MHVEGQTGSLVGNVVIPIEETSSTADFVTSVNNTFATVPGVTASGIGNRITFLGASTGDFSSLLNAAQAAGLGVPLTDLMHDDQPSDQ